MLVEALWTFEILHYLFSSLIQFTAGKTQGSHRIPQSSASLSLAFPNTKWLFNFPENHEYILMCFILVFFVCVLFLFYALLNYNIFCLNNQSFLSNSVFILGYWNLSVAWFHMRNMKQFHKVYDLAATYHELLKQITDRRPIKPRLQCSVSLGWISILCIGHGSGICLFLKGAESWSWLSRLALMLFILQQSLIT